MNRWVRQSFGWPTVAPADVMKYVSRKSEINEMAICCCARELATVFGPVGVKLFGLLRLPPE